MKIGVFGGAGFLGTYLLEELSRDENSTIVSIDLKPALTESVRSLVIDILDFERLEECFREEEFDVVYNLAGFASLEMAIENPMRTMQLNIMGNMNILELSRIYRVKHFLYASSAYAVSTKGSFYGISKLSSEKIIKEYNVRYGLNYTILRYGSVYSEKDFDNNYIFSLVKEAMLTGRILHHGDGEERREYIHAADAAKLSVQVMNNPEFFGKHLILTGNQGLRRLDLFKMIAEIANREVSIELKDDGYVNHYKHTPYAFAPEVSERLMPNPFIDMGQGILSCFNEIHRLKNG